MSFANLGTSFIILIDVDGTRKIVRDVVVESFSELKRVIGRNVPLQPSALEDDAEISYFDDRTNQFAALHEAAWGHITTRRHLEIRVTSNKRRMAEKRATGTSQQAAARATPTTTGSVAAVSGASEGKQHAAASASLHESSPSETAAARAATLPPGSGGPAPTAVAVATSTLRARIIDAVRRITRSSASASIITRQQLIELCSRTVRKYGADHNVTEADLDAEVPSTADGVDYLWLERYVTEIVAALRAPETAVVAATNAAPGSAPFHHAPRGRLQPTTAVSSQEPSPTQPGLFSSTFKAGATVSDALLANAATPVLRRSTSHDEQPAAVAVVDRPPQVSALTSNPSSRPLHAAVLSPPAKPDVLLFGGRHHSMPEAAAAPQLQGPKDDSLGYYDNPAAARAALAQHRRSSKASSNKSSTVAAGAASTFRAVLYSVCGAVPAVPQLPEEQAPTLRVSLMCPRLWSPDEDVLVTAHILTRTSVVLTLWLAYGPNRITLDLDDMHQRQCITTFQVSETGLLITIRRGTLVPGWEYLLHLRASSEVTGSSAASQAVFRVERNAASLGARESVPSPYDMAPWGAVSATPVAGGRSNAVSPWSASFVTPSLRGVTAQQVHHLPGYQADEDPNDGAIVSPSKMQPRDVPHPSSAGESGSHSKRGQRLLANASPSGAGGGAESRVISASLPNPPAGDRANVSSGQPLRTTPAATPSRALWTGPTAAAASTESQALLHSAQRSGRSYQEQLRRFLREEIYPLIQLCSRPNVSQDDFDSIIARVAQMYGNARAEDENLDVALQREIVARVKDEVVRLVQLGRGTTDSTMHRFSSTDIPSVGLRPQYATPVRK